MSDWTRRDVIKLGLSSLAISCAHLRRPPVSRESPRYYVVILLSGGFDAIYTTNPIIKKDVESDIDLPYSPNEIVDAGGFQLGPHFAPLARWNRYMAILNGVQVGVANHETATTNFTRMRTRVGYSTPAALDVIAEYRDRQPLGCVTLGPSLYFDYSSKFWGVPEKIISARAANDPNERNLFDEIEARDPADLERLAAAYRRHSKRLRDGGAKISAQRATTATNLDEIATLFERLRSVPRFKLEQWSPNPARQNIARNLQRTLWLFENDLTNTVFLRVGMAEWDSHYGNVLLQTEWNGHIAMLLDRFLAELDARHNGYGSLLENSLVVAGSEIGRFPRINADDGKDHFPELPLFFFGKGVQTGQSFGSTGRQMEALPVSLKTGHHVDAGGTMISLDDVGTTLMHIAGIDPERHGYFGQRLSFLEAS